MPKKISITDKREWLRRYENGETEIQIRNSLPEKSRYDLKTIKSGIESARFEKAASSALDSLIRDSLRKHQDDLLGVVNNILSALVLPDRYLPSGKIIEGKHTKSIPIELPESQVFYDINKGLVLALKDEDSFLWGLLWEHMRHDNLRKKLNDWKSAVTSHFLARNMLALEIENLLKTKTGYEIIDNGERLPVLYLHTVERFIQQVTNISLGGSQRKALEDLLIVNTRDGIVLLVNDTLARCPGTEEECKQNVLDAVKAAIKSKEATRVSETYYQIDKPMKKVRDILEEITSLGMIPGKCRVCRRMGL